MLATDRNTPRRDGESLVIGVAGGVRIFAGALVAINVEGYAEPGMEKSSLRGLGRAEYNEDNINGSAGDITVEVSKGVFRFDNHEIDTVTMADIGRDCYIVDDHTVAFSSRPGERMKSDEVFRPILDSPPKRGVAGKVYDVDASGVWVRFQ